MIEHDVIFHATSGANDVMIERDVIFHATSGANDVVKVDVM